MKFKTKEIKCLATERELSQDIFCLYESMLRGWGGRWEVGGGRSEYESA